MSGPHDTFSGMRPSVLDRLPASVVTWTAKWGDGFRVTWISASLYRVMGAEPEEDRTGQLLHHVHQEDRQRVREQEPGTEIEFLLESRDGTLYTIQLHLSAVVDGSVTACGFIQSSKSNQTETYFLKASEAPQADIYQSEFAMWTYFCDALRFLLDFDTIFLLSPAHSDSCYRIRSECQTKPLEEVSFISTIHAVSPKSADHQLYHIQGSSNDLARIQRGEAVFHAPAQQLESSIVIESQGTTNSLTGSNFVLIPFKANEMDDFENMETSFENMIRKPYSLMYVSVSSENAAQLHRLTPLLTHHLGNTISAMLRRLCLETIALYFNTTLDMLAIADFRGYFIILNPNFENVLGYSRDELRAHPFLHFVHPDDRQATIEIAEHIYKGNSAVAFVNRYVKADGSSCYLQWNTIPDYGRGFLLASCRDITQTVLQQHQLENALESAAASSRIKSQFLMNMSHEIRTPLNGIIGNSKLLLSAALPGELADIADSISSSGYHLAQVINDILDISKIESEKLELETSPMHIVSVVDDAVRLCGSPPSVQEGKVTLTTVADPLVFQQSVLGDATRLRQVLVNLIGNALKFTRQGSVTVFVDTMKMSADTIRVRFRIQDTGIGIPKEKLGSLFDAFNQVDSSITKEFGGTGLGTTISSRLIAKMDGSIHVTSTFGQGSTFEVKIPFTIDSTLPRIQAVPQPETPRLALVSKHKDTCDALTACFAAAGVQVQTVAEDKLVTTTNAAHGLIIDKASVQVTNIDRVLAYGKRQRRNGQPWVYLVLQGPTSQKERAASPSTPPSQKRRRKHVRKQTQRSFVYLTSKPFQHPLLLYPLLQYVVGALNRKHKEQEETAFDRDGTLTLDFATKYPLRILIAEDNAVNAKMLVRILSRLGYAPRCAHNGKEAVESCCNHPTDVVLMDVMMPVMDGIRATATILNTVTDPPYIIALTASAAIAEKKRCSEAGMLDFLSKPFQIEHLVAALQRAFCFINA